MYLRILCSIVLVVSTGVVLAPVEACAQLPGPGDVVVSFVTQNYYGNNLYIDNLTLGNQYDTDIGIVSINNIAPDTSYGFGNTPTVVAPKVTITNLGRNNVTTPFTLTLTAAPGGYTSTKSAGSLGGGAALEITFDQISIPASQAMVFRVVHNLPADQNRSNDTLNQRSTIFPGAQRTVLLEEWTSSTCGPCAANNPTIDAFVQAHFDSVVAIKYHVGWPAPGNDPMYLHNPTQSYDRRYYYGVSSAPHVIVDGVVEPSYPYSQPWSLPDAFYRRYPRPTPISIAVSDSRLSNDTIQANVALTVISPLVAGMYKLRVEAVERAVHFASPPGTNGERDFFDVFRRSYPTSEGTPIPTTVGTHNFVFKYKVDTAVWIDSMMYTAIFVQNDLTKEVLACSKARTRPLSCAEPRIHPSVDRTIKPDVCSEVSTRAGILSRGQDSGLAFEGAFHYELFETAFPPRGWKLANPDNSITFTQFAGADGPSFGGTKCVKMDFYNYSGNGRLDSLSTVTYRGLRGTDTLRFDWAYAPYPGNYPDRLIVQISTDGGLTFPTTIFDRAGAALGTVPATQNEFVPRTSGDWRTFAYSLTQILTSATPGNGAIQEYGLGQNYPNPFNPTTTINYAVTRTERVVLKVLDIVGREVTTLVNETKPAGAYSLRFDAERLPAGVYFYRIQAGDFVATRKLLLVK